MSNLEFLMASHLLIEGGLLLGMVVLHTYRNIFHNFSSIRHVLFTLAHMKWSPKILKMLSPLEVAELSCFVR